MAIFLVLPTADGTIDKALGAQREQSKLEFITLPKGGYFVSYKGTSEELSALLGITDGTSGAGIVAAVNSYFGRAPSNIWEWVGSRME